MADDAVPNSNNINTNNKSVNWLMVAGVVLLVVIVLLTFGAFGSRLGIGQAAVGPVAVAAPTTPQPTLVAVNTSVPPVLSDVKSVQVTFGHRCRIFNQEGELLAQRYVANELACANFEANFRAKIADPDAFKSIQAYQGKLPKP